jgi:hypothetical protein
MKIKAAPTGLRQKGVKMGRSMAWDVVLGLAAVVLPFVIFALALAWADHQANHRTNHVK